MDTPEESAPLTKFERCGVGKGDRFNYCNVRLESIADLFVDERSRSINDRDEWYTRAKTQHF